MKSLIPILIVLAIASAYGIWYQRSRGKIKAAKSSTSGLTSEILGQPLGSRATLVQFSSAFCTPCRATRTLLQNMVADLFDVEHIEIDAEANLDLVRKLDIRSTPTTLFLDSRGVEVGRAVGAPKREQVATALAALR
ncbi:MAG: thioredoxin fold domain-containing protein [Actinobacteria bacterium]|nr:thioredoxin family protein [Actinomycetota bacterium]MSW47183.1 thioredoxin fold domain-containing protein [Actinomycetota bacterium]MSX24272.1 thioredoxin fold domain-containing protein [Actinomycetota bacterium]MSY46167.1 thioredoxin fold domain-containing protein [Actinomycetota bacterium]MSY56669.1 thioredoxin fold domain-containing protein [Actinomycetota bacterium]